MKAEIKTNFPPAISAARRLKDFCNNCLYFKINSFLSENYAGTLKPKSKKASKAM